MHPLLHSLLEFVSCLKYFHLLSSADTQWNQRETKVVTIFSQNLFRGCGVRNLFDVSACRPCLKRPLDFSFVCIEQPSVHHHHQFGGGGNTRDNITPGTFEERFVLVLTLHGFRAIYGNIKIIFCICCICTRTQACRLRPRIPK